MTLTRNWRLVLEDCRQSFSVLSRLYTIPHRSLREPIVARRPITSMDVAACARHKYYCYL